MYKTLSGNLNTEQLKPGDELRCSVIVRDGPFNFKGGVMVFISKTIF